MRRSPSRHVDVGAAARPALAPRREPNLAPHPRAAPAPVTAAKKLASARAAVVPRAAREDEGAVAFMGAPRAEAPLLNRFVSSLLPGANGPGRGWRVGAVAARSGPVSVFKCAHAARPARASRRGRFPPPAGPLRFAPSLYLPTAAALSVAGAVHAPAWAAAVVHALPRGVVDAVPLSAILSAAPPAAVDAAVAAAAGLLCVGAGFVALPALDALLGTEVEQDLLDDGARGGDRVRGAAPRSSPAPYRAWLFVAGVAHLAVVAAGVAAAPAMVGDWGALGGAAAAPLVAAAVSVGVSGGLAFTVAHEATHGHTKGDRALAAALLATAGYGHWRDAHLAHHRNVGTRRDPATARLGETLYEFIPRSVWGGVVDGLAADAGRVRRRGLAAARAPLWVGAPAALIAVAAATGGVPSVSFFVIQVARGGGAGEGRGGEGRGLRARARAPFASHPRASPIRRPS